MEYLSRILFYASAYSFITIYNFFFLKKERMINTLFIHFTDISKFGLIEFQIETGLGIICSVLGLLTTAMYYRTEGNRRYVGLSACVSCLLTGKKKTTLKPYDWLYIMLNHTFSIILLYDWDIIKCCSRGDLG